MSNRVGRCTKCRCKRMLRGLGRCFECWAEDFPDQKGGAKKGQRENEQSDEELDRLITEQSATMPGNRHPGFPVIVGKRT